MSTVLFGVLCFTGVIVALVGLLLVARAILLPSGAVEVRINDDPARTLAVPAGGTLLAALAARNVFLPSACGGRGTCGACKVTVREGGGAALPTEAPHLGRAERRAGVRLACQVKVWRDMRIELSPDVLETRRWRCRVRSNDNVATYIKELVLDLPPGEEVAFRSGSYVQVVCPPHRLSFRDFAIGPPFRDEWDRYDLWRFESVTSDAVERAYSMANWAGEKGRIVLNVRIALPPPDVPEAPPGRGSSYLFGLARGAELAVSGPFGHFFVRDTDAEMCFVGGGAGMAPMRSHILDQLLGQRTRRRITFWYGARSLREAFYVDDFDRLAAAHANFEWHLALSAPAAEDGWSGPTGFIHQVLHDAYLAAHDAPEEVEYYLCGPPAMIAACRKMLDDLGVPPGNVLFDDFSV
jgi:Na+-transporting NADH:ubiquinone oxidoreductase subunit F